MKELALVFFATFKILVPDTKIIPQTIIKTPPSTDLGIATSSAPNFGSANNHFD